MNAKKLVKDRAKTHGDFAETAFVASKLQYHSTITHHAGVSPQIEHARQMICVKLARIACGDPFVIDHWKDIAGYAELVVQYLENSNRAS
jgi:hypothetical protein